MFKTYSSSSSLVITSRWFATSRLVAPVSVRLVYLLDKVLECFEKWKICVWNISRFTQALDKYLIHWSGFSGVEMELLRCYWRLIWNVLKCERGYHVLSRFTICCTSITFYFRIISKLEPYWQFQWSLYNAGTIIDYPILWLSIFSCTLLNN